MFNVKFVPIFIICYKEPLIQLFAISVKNDLIVDDYVNLELKKILYYVAI